VFCFALAEAMSCVSCGCCCCSCRCGCVVLSLSLSLLCCVFVVEIVCVTILCYVVAVLRSTSQHEGWPLGHEISKHYDKLNKYRDSRRATTSIAMTTASNNKTNRLQTMKEQPLQHPTQIMQCSTKLQTTNTNRLIN
jgi:hypothetical protein